MDLKTLAEGAADKVARVTPETRQQAIDWKLLVQLLAQTMISIIEMCEDPAATVAKRAKDPGFWDRIRWRRAVRQVMGVPRWSRRQQWLHIAEETAEHVGQQSEEELVAVVEEVRASGMLGEEE